MKHYKTMLRGFLSSYIETFRVSRHLSQEKMAEHLHISPRAYSNLKKGKFCFSILPLLFLLLMLDGEELKVFLEKLRGSMSEM